MAAGTPLAEAIAKIKDLVRGSLELLPIAWSGSADDLVDGEEQVVMSNVERLKLAALPVAAELASTLEDKQNIDATLSVLSGKGVGAAGLQLLASSTSESAINVLGGVSGLFGNHNISDLDAGKLTGEIDPARLPVLPGNNQVMSTGGLVDLTVADQATINQGTVVTTADGRRWLYVGSGSKTNEASYIMLADITPEWSAIAGKPAFGTASVQDVAAFLLSSGGALTGMLTAPEMTVGAPAAVNPGMKVDGAGNRTISFLTGGVKAYELKLSGGNQFYLDRFNPTTGAYLESSLRFDQNGVPSFAQRPTLGGVGLATLAEVGGGSGVAGVSSFKGRSGAVAPASGDYTAAQISYSDGSVSDALVAMAPIASPAFTGNPTAPTQVVSTNNTRLATTAFTHNMRGAWDVRRFGVIGNGTADDTAALLAATQSGRALFFPGGLTIRTTSGLEITGPQTWTTDGTVRFKYDAPNGSVVQVQLWFKDYVHAVGDFRVDHNAMAGGYVEPPANPGGYVKPHGNCVIISGDRSCVSGWTVTNSWDNGITVGAYNESTWAGIPGKPLGAIVDNIQTYACGMGVHGSAVSGFSGRLGGGVSVASGKATLISNCFDKESTQGFVHDVGAGGSASWLNCHSWGAKRDTVNGTGGTAWYVGTGDSQFVNCGSTLADWVGWDIDSPATNNQYTNCYSNGSGREGVIQRAADSTWLSVNVNSAWNSGAGANAGDAIVLDSGGSGGSGSARAVTGVSFIAPRVLNTAKTRYGLACAGTGVASVEIIGGALSGGAGPVNRNGKELTWLRNSAGTMQMQLSGGNTYVSGGSWQAPMQLGESRMWVDSGGRLRIKNGQPTSDGDGVVVGSQS